MKKLLVLFSVLFLALINSGEINGQIITLIAGSGMSGSTGDGGAATAAKLSTPYAAAYDNAGNLYIADFSNNKIREVTAAGVMSTFSTVAAAPSAIRSCCSGNSGNWVMNRASSPFAPEGALRPPQAARAPFTPSTRALTGVHRA